MDSKGVRYIINIVNTRKGGRKVRPGKLTVESNDQVDWINNLDEPALLIIDRGNEIFDGFPDGVAHYMVEILPGGSRSFQVLLNPFYGKHPYRVLGKNSQAYHSGGSDPRIDVL